LVELKIKK
jgi:hypothetical protein